MTTAPREGGDLYGWTPDTSVAGASWGELDPAVQTAALRWAVSVLWALSGRQFELHAHRVAPYLPAARPNAYAQRNRGLPFSVDYRLGRARQGLGCSTNVFRAPWPVHAVEGVQVDGVPLPVESWTLDPDGTLVRTDGGGWPVAQDVYAPSPRWLVDYVIGVEPPPGANIAAGRYADGLAELYGEQLCAIPAGARSIARTGMTIELPDPDALAASGRTGNDQVDAWLATVNPAGLSSSATVYSPDLGGHRFLT